MLSFAKFSTMELMQVFEFHFSAKTKSDLIFDSFCYEPENIYEKKMGSLYMVGFLKNALPKNVRLIKGLAGLIKDKYYRSTIFTPEKSLKESLKLANEHLEEITQRGDVSWLGNLDFAVLSLIPHRKIRRGVKLNFAKVGDIKILLAREGRIIDIDKKIKLDDIEPYPLKVFSNTVSGKLAENDLILVLTKDVFEFFQQENLLAEIAQTTPFCGKELKDILNGKKEHLVKISGVFLAINLTKEPLLGKKETISPKELKEFPLKTIFAPILKFFRKSKKVRPRSKKPKRKLKLAGIKIPKIKTPKIVFQNIVSAVSQTVKKTITNKIKPLTLHKNIVLVLFLGLILFLGFAFSQYEQNQRIRIYERELEEIQEELDTAEGFLILKETSPQSLQTANLLLKGAWDEISVLHTKAIGLPQSFRNKVLVLKNEISEKLFTINKLEQIEKPKILFEFDHKIFVPQKITVKDDTLYFFSPYSQNIFSLKENGKTKILETEQKINLAIKFDDSIAFFSKPNQLIILENDTLVPSSLQSPNLELDFQDAASFNSSFYFLDKKLGQIVKYPFLGNTAWGNSSLWLTQNTQRPVEADSFCVNGSIWVLKENAVFQYYAGRFQRELNFEIFPEPNTFSRVYCSPALSYIYILEPIQRRIVVLNKEGQIIKQFQSESFNNLLDFAVSDNGKTIYLLNGLKVYQITF